MPTLRASKPAAHSESLLCCLRLGKDLVYRLRAYLPTFRCPPVWSSWCLSFSRLDSSSVISLAALAALFRHQALLGEGG